MLTDADLLNELLQKERCCDGTAESRPGVLHVSKVTLWLRMAPHGSAQPEAFGELVETVRTPGPNCPEANTLQAFKVSLLTATSQHVSTRSYSI